METDKNGQIIISTACKKIVSSSASLSLSIEYHWSKNVIHIRVTTVFLTLIFWH